MSVSRDTTTSWDATAGDVPWRAWVTAIHNALDAMAELVQTADTGQINPATATFPGVADTVGGYEIWRFDDPEQPTNPIFVKVQYERGDAATELRLRFQVGKGSNGTGTLTNAGTIATSTGAGNVDSANRLIHCSMIDGELVFYAAPDITAGDGFLMLVSRTRDRAGDFDGDVVALLACGPATSAAASERWSGAAWVSTGATIGGGGAASQAVDGAERIAPLMITQKPRPIRGLAWIRSAAVAAGESGAVELEGESRQFIALGSAHGGVFVSTNVAVTPVFAGVAAVAGRLIVRNE